MKPLKLQITNNVKNYFKEIQQALIKNSQISFLVYNLTKLTKKERSKIGENWITTANL